MLAICSPASMLIARFCLAGYQNRPVQGGSRLRRYQTRLAHRDEVKVAISRPPEPDGCTAVVSVDAVSDADGLVRAAQAAKNTSGAEQCRILIKEVMLHRPDVVDAQFVGQHDLVKSVVQQTLSSPSLQGFGS